ncbi:unnamed protein product [Bursaphelenchus okinawaensis]|uniref:Receptor expression-enhancing protein n=1 Tax=Bursaphelenchus okinawaensis TaxID=465554 RepID=A0A811L1K3_9BILA|nr:unnamed protein product [Bursaphelenchus okinawaensis]CAG9114542.1 unnamed protein product [Bursaphelenchus okinawaensis]
MIVFFLCEKRIKSERPDGPAGGLVQVVLSLNVHKMISILLSRLLILVSGIMYPSYRSFKAVRLKDAKEYMKWMMYWIAFAVFCVFESFADIFVSFWFPFYYELKIAFVLWLVSPWTKGATILYRKWIHPTLMKHEDEIDRFLEKAKEETYNQAVNVGRRSILYAREVVATAASRSQAHLAEQALAFSGTLASSENLNRDENAKPRRRRSRSRNSSASAFDIDSRMDPMLDSRSERVTVQKKAPSAPVHSDSDDDMELLDRGDQEYRPRGSAEPEYNTLPRRSSRTRRQLT